ncbi:hypothetical protein ES705_27633 [subsurface metagenome]|jgi:hypothetical protein
MIVIQIYTKDAEQFAGVTSAVDFENCKKRLRLYFRNIGKCKAMLFAGEKISMPYVEIQKDRRVRDIKVKNERRSTLKL